MESKANYFLCHPTAFGLSYCNENWSNYCMIKIPPIFSLHNGFYVFTYIHMYMYAATFFFNIGIHTTCMFLHIFSMCDIIDLFYKSTRQHRLSRHNRVIFTHSNSIRRLAGAILRGALGLLTSTQ